MLCRKIECTLDDNSKIGLQKIANAAEKAFADRAILFDENRLLFEQNNERTIGKSVKPIVVRHAKVMRCRTLSKRRDSEKRKRKSRQVGPDGEVDVKVNRLRSEKKGGLSPRRWKRPNVR